MSDNNMVPLTNDNLPAEWQERLAGQAEEAAKTVRPSSSYISLRSGVLSYAGNPVANNKLECVVLGFAYENTMYGVPQEDGSMEEKPYNPDNPGNPLCWSIMVPKSAEDKPETMVPSSEDPYRQSEECKDCQWHQWASSLRGGRGKQCQERRRLIIIPVSALEDVDEVITAEVALMKIPVTSSKQWDNYVSQLATVYKRPSFAVVTEISTQPHPKHQFTVNFKPLGGVDAALLQAVQDKLESSTTTLTNGYEPPESDEAEDGNKKY